MKKAPKPGNRVRFPGNLAIGPCEATVISVYPVEEWSGDIDDPRPTGRMKPESEWSVAIQPDVLPALWPYSGTNRFAAEVSTLSPIG
jgi:hypothetical protein